MSDISTDISDMELLDNIKHELINFIEGGEKLDKSLDDLEKCSFVPKDVLRRYYMTPEPVAMKHIVALAIALGLNPETGRPAHKVELDAAHVVNAQGDDEKLVEITKDEYELLVRRRALVEQGRTEHTSLKLKINASLLTNSIKMTMIKLVEGELTTALLYIANNLATREEKIKERREQAERNRQMKNLGEKLERGGI
jgi:hypothetical protein